MKHRWWMAGILAAAMVFTLACGMVNTLLSGRSSGTVAELWADVPRMEGMTKAELDFPLAARLALQAVSQGKMDFVAYATDATPQAVLDYYTVERMSGAGWNAQDGTGCFGDAQSAATGAICVFSKSADGQEEVLGIVAANDESIGKTALFFARIDATQAESSGN